MSLTEEQIKILSLKLSKIELKEGKFTEDINEILKYIDLLNELDTSGVKPTVNVVEKETKLREDKIITKEVEPSDLLNCSEQKVISNQITISNIMK